MHRSPKKSAAAWLIVLFIGIMVLMACGGSADATNTAASNATSAPAKPLKWTKTQSFQGSGIKKTAYFTVSDDWKLKWACDPASFSGEYNVQVYVYGSDGTAQDVAVNAICKAGNTSGETEEHTAGKVYLEINSEGAWTVEIDEMK